MEAGRILVSVHGARMGTPMPATTCFFRTCLLNGNMDVHRNYRGKTKTQKFGDSNEMVNWDTTPSHFSFSNHEIFGIRVSLVFLKKIEVTFGSVDIPYCELKDDKEVRRLFMLKPKKNSLQSTIKLSKNVCWVDLSITYESNRTSSNKGDMVSYTKLEQQQDQVKTRKKLERKGKKENLVLEIDEVVVGKFRCIWRKMRGEIFISTRRILFLSDRLISRGKNLQIFWNQVTSIEKKKTSRGIAISLVDKHTFVFEGFLKLNRVELVLQTLKQQYILNSQKSHQDVERMKMLEKMKKDLSLYDDLLEDSEEIGEGVGEGEVGEGEVGDEILDDLVDQHDDEYLALSSRLDVFRDFKGEYGIGEKGKEYLQTISNTLQEERITREEEEEATREDDEYSFFSPKKTTEKERLSPPNIQLPSNTDSPNIEINQPNIEIKSPNIEIQQPKMDKFCAPHFGRFEMHEGDEVVFENSFSSSSFSSLSSSLSSSSLSSSLSSSSSSLSSSSSSLSFGGGKGEEPVRNVMFFTLLSNLKTFLVLLPTLIFSSLLMKDFNFKRWGDVIVFTLFLVFSAPVMFFVMRSFASSFATLILTKVRRGVVDKHTSLVSEIILPYLLTPFWYLILVLGVSFILDGIELKGAFSTILLTALIAFVMSHQWDWDLPSSKRKKSDSERWKKLQQIFNPSSLSSSLSSSSLSSSSLSSSSESVK